MEGSRMSFNDLRKGRVSLASHYYFVTTVTHGRHPWFAEFSLARCVVKHMQQLHDDESLFSIAWGIMPDHLHWLFQLGNHHDLSRLIGQFKGRTSKALNDRINRKGQLWQAAFFDHALRKEENIRQVARYIVANPLRAGLVENIADYPHWDAIWL